MARRHGNHERAPGVAGLMSRRRRRRKEGCPRRRREHAAAAAAAAIAVVVAPVPLPLLATLLTLLAVVLLQVPLLKVLSIGPDAVFPWEDMLVSLLCSCLLWFSAVGIEVPTQVKDGEIKKKNERGKKERRTTLGIHGAPS